MPPAVEGQVLNHWTTRKVPCCLWFCVYCFTIHLPGDHQEGLLLFVVLCILFYNIHLPGGPVVKNLPFYCRGHGFDPWLGN